MNSICDLVSSSPESEVPEHQPSHKGCPSGRINVVFWNQAGWPPLEDLRDDSLELLLCWTQCYWGT